jgi:F-type H+-transporting ATPase subunit a
VVSGPAKTVDIITPHITDSHYLELPFIGEYELPRWAPIHIGNTAIDLSPTKHVVMLLVAAFLCLVVLIPAATSNTRQTATAGHAKGFAGVVESIVLYIRNEVVLPNVGHHGEAYVPFALTLFFFILFANLLGLIPYGSTATGNISVTGMLAIITFFVIELAGVRALGRNYWRTVIYWPKDQPVAMNAFMTLIMTPVELIGKITKPFALAIRLFANMTAGHVVLLAFISLIFTFGKWAVVIAPFGMGVAISVLELVVAFLQAFIFTLLASVFIGLIREGAH